eukprot:Opistho-2@2238
MTDAIFQARELNDYVRIIAHAPASEKYMCFVRFIHCCNPCSWFGGCDEVQRRTYMTVYENKVEYNAPYMRCCFQCDNVKTLYLDRDIVRQVGRAGVCQPACTHCHFCPTCCDVCGEGIIFHGGNVCSPKQGYSVSYGGHGGGVCCCSNWFLFCGLDNADAMVAVITTQYMASIAKRAAPISMQMPQSTTTVVIQQPVYAQQPMYQGPPQDAPPYDGGNYGPK